MRIGLGRSLGGRSWTFWAPRVPAPQEVDGLVGRVDDHELPAPQERSGDEAVDAHALAAAGGAGGQKARDAVEVDRHGGVGAPGFAQGLTERDRPDVVDRGVERVGDRGREGRQLTGADPHGQGRGVRPQVPAGTADDRGDRLAEPGVVPRGHVARRQVDVEAAAVRAAHPHLPRPDPQGGGQGLTGAQLVGVEALHDGTTPVRVEDGHGPSLTGVAGVERLGEQRRLLGPVGGFDVGGQTGALAPVIVDDGGHRGGVGEIGPSGLRVDARQGPVPALDLADFRLQLGPVPCRVEAVGQDDGQDPSAHAAALRRAEVLAGAMGGGTVCTRLRVLVVILMLLLASSAASQVKGTRSRVIRLEGGAAGRPAVDDGAATGTGRNGTR